jgi:hypothetical protein
MLIMFSNTPYDGDVPKHAVCVISHAVLIICVCSCVIHVSCVDGTPIFVYLLHNSMQPFNFKD